MNFLATNRKFIGENGNIILQDYESSAKLSSTKESSGNTPKGRKSSKKGKSGNEEELNEIISYWKQGLKKKKKKDFPKQDKEFMEEELKKDTANRLKELWQVYRVKSFF